LLDEEGLEDLVLSPGGLEMAQVLNRAGPIGMDCGIELKINSKLAPPAYSA
jgi:hypothetical protein